MFSVAYDQAIGCVICRSEGFFTIEEAKAYVLQSKLAAERCMEDRGDIKILVISDGTVQSSEVAEHYAAGSSSYLEFSRTRIALVLPSSLVKMQITRIVKTDAAKTDGSVHLNSSARLLSGASAGFMPLREAAG